jgi:predicted molibdopterin-dependent oxidoreductase YjgC
VATITIDDVRTKVSEGDTVASALLASGRRAWRYTDSGDPRGVFCAIGVCFDCTLIVDGKANVRACMTTVRDGMHVSTGRTP